MQTTSQEPQDFAEEPALLALRFCSRKLLLVQLRVELPPDGLVPQFRLRISAPVNSF
jgi:hypothetical protein